MPEVVSTVTMAWGQAITLFGVPVALAWGESAQLWSLGGAYTPAGPPSGGTPTEPSTDPEYTIGASGDYDVVHDVTVIDLRDGSALDVDSVQMSTDEDSLFWSVTLAGGQSLFDTLRAGEQPPIVRITLDGEPWRFAIESVSRARSHGKSAVQARGRSLTCAAGAPFEAEQTWTIEGDTTAAQIAAAANVYTGLQVEWLLDDWLIPAGVFSHTGAPLSVVKRVADAVGAIVQSSRDSFGVRVLPRYGALPNEWMVVAPDAEVALGVLDSESFERADRPDYDGIYVTGQQDGAAAYIRLAGSGGGTLHPMVTDALLTAENACVMRGMAELGKSGQQQRHTISLPVLDGKIADVGLLIRVADPVEPWAGVVRSVQVQIAFPSARQTVVLERHTRPIAGTVTHTPAAGQPGSPTYLPLKFNGPIQAQVLEVGDEVSINLAAFYTGGKPAYTYSLRSGTLPSWLTLAGSVVAGTVPSGADHFAVRFRATDKINSTADSNEVPFTLAAPFTGYVVLFDFEGGTEGQKLNIPNKGTGGGAINFGQLVLRPNGGNSHRSDGSLRAAAGAFSAGARLFDARDFVAEQSVVLSAFEFPAYTSALHVPPNESATIGCRVKAKAPTGVAGDGGYTAIISWNLDVANPNSGDVDHSMFIAVSTNAARTIVEVAFQISNSTTHSQALTAGQSYVLEMTATPSGQVRCFVNGTLAHTGTFNRSAPRTGKGYIGSVFTTGFPTSEVEALDVDEIFAYRGTLHTATHTPRLTPIVPPGGPASSVRLYGVPSTIPANVATAGAIVSNRGTDSVNWQLSGSGLTASPSSGTLAVGADVNVLITGTSAGTKTLTLSNTSGGSVAGSPASIVVTAASVLLNFEGIAANTNSIVAVGNHYLAAHGVAFPTGSAFNSSAYGSYAPSPTSLLFLTSGTALTMNRSAGFSAISFWYSRGASGGTFTWTVYSEVSGGGSVVATGEMEYPGGSVFVDNWTKITPNLAGATGKSIVWSGTIANQMALDNVEFTPA